MSGPEPTVTSALVALRGNLEDTLASLRIPAVTRAGSPAQIDRANIRHAVEAFLMGELSAEQLERWAEAVHSAQDVTLDPADEPFLTQALFELSTPELFGSMEEIAVEILGRDGGAGGR